MTSKVEKEATVFNEKYPVGTAVRYWPGQRHGKGCESKTRTRATIIGNHTAVVWLEDHSACVALSHVQPIED